MDVYFGGHNYDPTLNSQSYQTPNNVDDKIEQLKQMQHALEVQKQNMMTSKQQMMQPSQQGQAPVWDEIDSITSSMSDREFEIVNQNEEFQHSQQSLMSLLQREYMRIMRPIVENTKDGKDTLEKHLTLIKRLKKSASDEASKNLELFNEYTEKYSDMPYSEFLKMKKGGKKK